MKIISCRVTDAEYERLRWYCALHGGTISEYIRDKMLFTLKNAEREDPEIWQDMEEDKKFHEEMKKKYLK